MIVQSPKYGKITLADTAFSSGGEGEVRNIVSPSHLTGNCVKIYYTQKRTKQQENKIRFMVDNPPQQVEQKGFKIGWAIDIIHQNKKFIGFMMPLAFPNSEKLVILTVPTLSKKYAYSWQKFDRKHGKAALFNRLKLMNNIAIPIHLLHQTGKYVLQDFKPDNVLITHSGQVTICDMDSIQITNGQQILFRGTAATAGYAPPEFENNGVGKSTTIPLQRSWDNFALSVVFYQLLFGLHPYAVTPKRQKDANSSEISTNISDDLFPFGSNDHKIQIIPPLHNKFKILPQNIQDLFKRAFAFNADNRPGAEEWGKNIHDIICNAGTISEISDTPQSTPQQTNPPPKLPKKENKKGCFASFLILAVSSIIGCIYFYDKYQIDKYQIDMIHAEYVAVADDTISHNYIENAIYSNYTDGNSYATCNGIYPNDNRNAQYFSTDLGSYLNRNHFKIAFSFWVEEELKDQWVLMLSKSHRILGVKLNNGKIYISINNQYHDYETGETYKLNIWNYIVVEYNYSSVRVNNGNYFDVDMNTHNGDNVLSSINYSNGNAFKGYLNNIVVSNLVAVKK
jgi:hypothetical protein